MYQKHEAPNMIFYSNGEFPRTDEYLFIENVYWSLRRARGRTIISDSYLLVYFILECGRFKNGCGPDFYTRLVGPYNVLFPEIFKTSCYKHDSCFDCV